MEVVTFPIISSLYNGKLVLYKLLEFSDCWFTVFTTTSASVNLLQLIFDKYHAIHYWIAGTMNNCSEANPPPTHTHHHISSVHSLWLGQCRLIRVIIFLLAEVMSWLKLLQLRMLLLEAVLMKMLEYFQWKLELLCCDSHVSFWAVLSALQCSLLALYFDLTISHLNASGLMSACLPLSLIWREVH